METEVRGGSWSQCTKTCVGGTRTRYRDCDNPVNGSSPCQGLDNETVSCSTTLQCPDMCYSCMCIHLPTVLT